MRYVCQIENFACGEINERSFSNTHPWMKLNDNRLGWDILKILSISNHFVTFIGNNCKTVHSWTLSGKHDGYFAQVNWRHLLSQQANEILHRRIWLWEPANCGQSQPFEDNSCGDSFNIARLLDDIANITHHYHQRGNSKFKTLDWGTWVVNYEVMSYNLIDFK